MKVALNLFGIALISCIVSNALGLQIMLSSKEPHCIYVNPIRTGGKITLNYVVTGVNEDNTNFIVSEKCFVLV